MVLVGDPEQSIMGFTKRKKNMNGISKAPIITIQKQTTYEIEKLKMNYRSSQKIVDFINQFHSFIQQEKSNEKITSDNAVLFINEIEKERLISKFNDLCIDEKYCSKKPKSKMFVAYENKMYSGYCSNTKGKLGKNTSAIEFVLDMLSQILNRHKYELADTLCYKDLELRRKCLEIFKDVKAKPQLKADDLAKRIEFEFNISLDNFKLDKDAKPKYKSILETFIKEAMVFPGYQTTERVYGLGSCEETYLTIHKAKGLQADAVLVLSKNEKELLKWLETDNEKRIVAEDGCRLGYVAFSRAKYFLCIGCISEISDHTKSKLSKLGVLIA